MKKISKVLLVDDDDLVNSINKIMIGHAKFASDIIIENSAQGALELLKIQEAKDELPEVIFLDINMPEMNGWDFMEAYNQLGIQNAPKIIVLTSSINPSDEARARSTPSVSDFLSKPLSVEILNDIGEKHFY